MSPFEIVWRTLWNYVRDLDPWHWIVAGDSKPYAYVAGQGGTIFAVTAVLAVVGGAAVLRSRPLDRWWAFVIAALLLSPVPAALTRDRYDVLRLSAYPLLLALLAGRGLVEVARVRQRAALAAVAAAALGVTAFQFWQFADAYQARGPARRDLFEASVPVLLQHAFANAPQVYVDHDDPYTRTQARWYALETGIAEAPVPWRSWPTAAPRWWARRSSVVFRPATSRAPGTRRRIRTGSRGQIRAEADVRIRYAEDSLP